MIRTAANARPGIGRQAATVAGVVLVVASISVMFWKNVYATPPRVMQDTEAYGRTAAALADGRSVYDSPSDVLPFTYPPFAALLAAPLGLMPVRVVNILWVAGIAAITFAFVRVGFRAALDRAPPPYRIGIALVLTAVLLWIQPLVENVLLGQVNLFLAALCLLDVTARNPRWPRGCLVGFATAVKLVPGVFAMYLWLTGRRRAAIVALATAAACTLLAAAVLPGDTWRYWSTELFDTSRIGRVAYTSNQGVHGIVARLLGEGGAATVAWLVLAGALAVVGFRRAVRAFRGGDDLAGVVIVGLVGALISPIAWIHHLVWVVPALGLVAGDLRDRRRVVAVAAAVVLMILRLPWWSPYLLHHGWAAHALGVLWENLYGLIALALVFAVPIPSGGKRLGARRRPFVTSPA